jgi:hypothetical protein
MSIRIASSVLVSALIRKAEVEGGFGAVLAKGDANAGSVLVILAERGENACLYERILQPSGDYAWHAATRESADVPEFVARRRRFDPDSWVIELDIPARERFAAAMNAFD